MKKLTIRELSFILESLKYTKRKFEDYPIGKEGYPDYEFKQKRIAEAVAVFNKVQDILKEENKTNTKPAKEASNTFHNIMKASMTVGLNNPKPKVKQKKSAKK